MYEGNAVDLQMEKVIAADAILDDETHHCQVFRYDMEEDYIYLQLKEDDLTAISPIRIRHSLMRSSKNTRRTSGLLTGWAHRFSAQRPGVRTQHTLSALKHTRKRLLFTF